MANQSHNLTLDEVFDIVSMIREEQQAVASCLARLKLALPEEGVAETDRLLGPLLQKHAKI
jgi:hypothetical protein